MSWQYLIVGAAVIVSALYVVRAVVRAWRTGCANCAGCDPNAVNPERGTDKLVQIRRDRSDRFGR